MVVVDPYSLRVYNPPLSLPVLSKGDLTPLYPPPLSKSEIKTTLRGLPQKGGISSGPLGVP